MPTEVAEPLRPVGGHDDGGPGGAGPAPCPLFGGVWWVAAALVLVEMAVSAGNGFHRDELYFIACGRHLAFGYVDGPLLAPALTQLATVLFSTSPTAVRALPALAVRSSSGPD